MSRLLLLSGPQSDAAVPAGHMTATAEKKNSGNMFPDVCLYMQALLSFLFHMLLMSQCAAEQNYSFIDS